MTPSLAMEFNFIFAVPSLHPSSQINLALTVFSSLIGTRWELARCGHRVIDRNSDTALLKHLMLQTKYCSFFKDNEIFFAGYRRVFSVAQLRSGNVCQACKIEVECSELFDSNLRQREMVWRRQRQIFSVARFPLLSKV